MAVNLHPTILTMLEEAKWMRRLGLKIPEKFHTLNMANVKKTYDQLKVSVCVCVCVCVCIRVLYKVLVFINCLYCLAVSVGGEVPSLGEHTICVHSTHEISPQ